MLNFLKKKILEKDRYFNYLISSLLIHAAKIDENYSSKRKKINKKFTI